MAVQLDKVEMALPCDGVDQCRILIDEDADRLDTLQSLRDAGGPLRLDEAMAPAPEDETDEIGARPFSRASRLDRLHAT